MARVDVAFGHPEERGKPRDARPHNQRAKALLLKAGLLGSRRRESAGGLNRPVGPDHETVTLHNYLHTLGEGEIMRGYDLPPGWVQSHSDALRESVAKLIAREFGVDLTNPDAVAKLPPTIQKVLANVQSRQTALPTDTFRSPSTFDGTADRIAQEYEVPGIVALQTLYRTRQEARLSDAEAVGVPVRRGRRRAKGKGLLPNVKNQINAILAAAEQNPQK